jgi:hypothetical protein
MWTEVEREGRHTDVLYCMALPKHTCNRASVREYKSSLKNSMLHLNLDPETFERKSTMLQLKCPAHCNTWD